MKKSNNRKLRIIIAGLCFALFITAAAMVSVYYDSEIEAAVKDGSPSEALLSEKLQLKRDQDVDVSKSEDTPIVGDTMQVDADAKTDVVYKSSNPKVASVDKDGNIKCKKIGKTKITVTADENSTYDEESEEIVLKVNGKEQSISGLEDSYEIEKEDSFDIDADATTKIEYKSEDTSIAKINEDGKVEGVGEGEVKILVTAVSDGTYAKTTEEVSVNVLKSHEERQQLARQAAVDWAIEIANDNSFHYGRSSWAHHFGCYFCGTNQKSGSAKRKDGASVSACEKTYCCNPFVLAAYVHGAGASEFSCYKKGHMLGLANERNPVLKNPNVCERVSKPSSITELEVGDILLTPTHAMMYAGDGKVVEAAHHDNGHKGSSYWNDSIRHGTISSHQWHRVTKIYRYDGVGKF